MEVISRKDAKARGLIRYFTGKPCPKGHITERLVSTFGCYACTVENGKAWKANNKEKVSARKKEYNAANFERNKATHKSWREKNKDRVKAYSAAYAAENQEKIKKYREENREKIRAKGREDMKRFRAESPERVRWFEARKRAIEEGKLASWDMELTEFVTEEAYRLLKNRRETTGIKWEVDHMIPYKSEVASGLHVWSNLQVIPIRLNRMKRNRMVFTSRGEWIAVA